MKKYPRVVWRKFKREQVPDHKTCVICGKLFGGDDSVFVKKTQYSWYRGDDVCDAFCGKCIPSRDQRKPENLKM
ncbi:hypothetical protein A2Z67_04920 [Candidatus Woesebacteria bacterium RBG_13_36_22]|uniref:Uncharacterized protein n=1 Tax=Candidatus Woesebacteria bacterium RBG_13_36_22 TaxID=1802478 RepID=A0A1F7X2Z6_9BACT|nr:MAG: hypothetical protein A2Z67_04920 [Candidatus Woesebacteria bacterium RBG_13_36_22]